MTIYTDTIQQMYVAYFNRPADINGLANWEAFAAGKSLESVKATISAEFAKSAEYTIVFKDMSMSQIVTKVYQNLLGREPDAPGLINWVNHLAAGRSTVASLVTDVIRDAGPGDVDTLKNKLAAASAFTKALDTVAEINAYAGAAANAVAAAWLGSIKETAASLEAATKSLDSTVSSLTGLNNGGVAGTTFTLTSGIDTITGTINNDTILGDANSVGAADQINGGAGVDTLKLYGTVTKSVISNIENIYLNNTLGDGNGNFDASGIAGVVSLEADGLTGSQTLTVTSGQAVALSNLQTTGKTQTIAGNTASSLNLSLNKVGRADGAVTQTVALTGTSLTSLNVAAVTADSAITLTNAGGKLASMTVTGDKAVTITESLSTLKTIDASANTGGVVIKAGGANNDLKFTGGSGNDAVWFNAGEFTNLDTIDLGAGTGDKVVIAQTSGLTATQYAALNGYKGVEVLGLNATGVSVDASKLTGGIVNFAVESGNYSVTVTESLATTKYSVDNTAGNSGTLTITNKTGENVTTLAIDNQSGASQTFAKVIATGISTVNLASTGKVNSENVLTELDNADNSNIVITGDRDLTITTALDGATTGSKVDANAFTGKLSVVGSGKSDILIGGSAADTLNGGAVTHTVTAANEVQTLTFSLASGTAANTDTVSVTIAGTTVTTTAGPTTVAGIATAVKDAVEANATTNAIVTVADNGAGVLTFTFKGTQAATDVGDITFANVDAGAGVYAAAVVETAKGVAAVTGTMDTLTGGAGADIFAFSTADVATTAGAVTATITDFVTGVDKIKVTNGADAGAGSATNFVKATSVASTLSALLTAADTALNGTVDYYVGQVGSDSYLVTDANGTGYTNVIKLTGVALAGIAATDLIA